MTITFKSYTRKNGTEMLYVNRSNGVSLGVSPEKTFHPYGKDSTKGKQKLWDATYQLLEHNQNEFRGDLAKAQGKVTLANGWVMVRVDADGTIGGHYVSELDAGVQFLVTEFGLARLGHPYSEPSRDEEFRAPNCFETMARLQAEARAQAE